MFQKSSSKPNRDDYENDRPRDRDRAPEKSSKSKKTANGTNVILSDVEICGTVKFKNDVIIDGKIDGEIYSDGCVTVGHKANVTAEIRSKSVIVEGCVKGNIYASDRLELAEHAEVTGDIEASVLSMQAGAILIGTSSVGSAPRGEKRNGSDPSE